MFWIPLILGAAGSGYGVYKLTEDRVPSHMKELYRLYDRELKRGNTQVYFDVDEGVFIDKKNGEVYFIAKDLIGSEMTVRGYVDPETLQPIQRPYWDLDIRDYGRDDDNDNKPLSADQDVDVYWKGLFNETRTEYTDPRQTGSVTAGELWDRIKAAEGKFESQQEKIKELQQVKFEEIISNYRKRGQQDKDSLTALLPDDAKKTAFIEEFTKLTGTDCSRFDKDEAFIAIYTGLDAVRTDVMVKANTSKEFRGTLNGFHKKVIEGRMHSEQAYTTMEALKAASPVLMEKQDVAPAAAPPVKPESDSILNSITKPFEGLFGGGDGKGGGMLEKLFGGAFDLGTTRGKVAAGAAALFALPSLTSLLSIKSDPLGAIGGVLKAVFCVALVAIVSSFIGSMMDKDVSKEPGSEDDGVQPHDVKDKSMATEDMLLMP